MNASRLDAVALMSTCPVASPAEAFGYDEDGNLKQDGTFTYTWDVENRLIAVQTKRSGDPVDGDRLLEFKYDYMSRRVEKTYKVYSGGWQVQSGYPQRFVYDGWNPVLVLNGSNETVRKYTWGLDLSQTVHGAAGIGGLLAFVETQGTTSETDDQRYWFTYDANGNVGQLLNADTLAFAARYEYDPCGNEIDVEYLPPPAPAGPGPYAATNRFCFSTRWLTTEIGRTGYNGAVGDSGLYYYGHRYYSPRLGRWISRDPIGEMGGLNLHAYVENAPTQNTDLLGRLMKPPAAPGGPGTVIDLPMVLGDQLLNVLELRLVQIVPWLWDLLSKKGELYEFNDELDELRRARPIRNLMNAFYLRYLDSLSLRGGWYHVDIPFQSAHAMVGPFELTVEDAVYPLTGYLLNGAHDVRVHGSLEVCREGNEYLFRNLSAKWQWYDEIDAHSILHL